MSRIMIAMVIAASAILASCNRSEQPANQTEEKPNRTETGATRATAAGPTNVTILLSGLMVLHKDKAKGTYEVGILPAGPPHQHDFAITVDGGDPKVLPAARNLTIEVTNSTPAAPTMEAKGHAGRRPDDINGQYDFDWVVDLEGPEFHTGENPLTLKPGKLNPIIHLPNGRIYTKYKSIDLQRSKGGAVSDFGFVPEGTAIEFELHQNQKLVLKDDSGSGNPIPLLQPSPGGHTVRIANVPHEKTKASDFLLYYDVLDVPKAEQVDFAEKKDPKFIAYNPNPDQTKTCCSMECTLVYLSLRKDPLK